MEWLSEHGIELAMFLLTLVVTCVGWIFEHKNAKLLNKERIQDINLLTKQVQALQKQADSLQKQADSLQEQTDMLRAEFDKPPFSDAEWSGSGEKFLIKNNGARNVIIDSVHSEQDDLQGQFRFKRTTPFTCAPGDTIEYLAVGTEAGRPNTIIEWHFDDSNENKTTRRSNFIPQC